MNKEDILSLEGEFAWDFGCHFFIETAKGNFVWSDPDYEGDNTLVPFTGTYKDYLRETGVPFCRDKGTHTIEAYCGKDIIFKD